MGWAYSAPEKVPADSLAKGLRDYVYDGVSVWWLFGRPMLNTLAVLMLLYVLRLQIKQGFSRRQQQEERHGRRTKGPELASAFAVARRKDGRHPFPSALRERAFAVAALWPELPDSEAPSKQPYSNDGRHRQRESNAIRQLLRQVRERGGKRHRLRPGNGLCERVLFARAWRFDSQSARPALPLLESWQGDRPRRNGYDYRSRVPAGKGIRERVFYRWPAPDIGPLAQAASHSRGTF